MDIIAKCAFGLKIDNLDDKHSEFMESAKRAFASPSNKSPITLLLCNYGFPQQYHNLNVVI